MVKATPDVVLDVMLVDVATCTRLVVCSAQPANFAGIAAVLLASVALTAGNGNGDYSVLNGNTSGRMLSVLIQSAIAITSSGTANHITLDDAAVLRYVTTCDAQLLTTGGTVTVPEWDIEIADPV